MTIWVIALSMFGVLAWHEWLRPWRARLPARLAALGLAVAALALLALEPRYPPRPTTGTVLVVTPGVSTARLRALVDSLQPRRIYQADGAMVPRQLAESVLRLRTLRDIDGSKGPPADAIVIAGWGLTPAALVGGDDLALVFLADPLPPGLAFVSVPPDPRVGDRLTVSGALQNMPDDSTWVVLETLAGPADSVRIRGRGDLTFRLGITPETAGPQQLILTTRNGRTTAAETLAVSIDSARVPRLLVLEGRPSFETTALRRWLASRGGQLAIRTRVSADRWQVSYVNRASRRLDRLDAETLEEFDILVTDDDALVALDASSRTAVSVGIQGGLGMLILGDAEQFARSPASWTPQFVLQPIEGLDERLVRPVWWPLSEPVAAPVPAVPFELKPNFGQEPIVRDQAGRVLAARAWVGEGRVALSLVAAPSRWQFEDDGAYDAYWSAMLDAVAAQPHDRWIVPAQSMSNEPATLVLETPTESPTATVRSPSGTIERVALVQNPMVPTQWTARYWPDGPGWYGLIANSGATSHLYVAGGTAVHTVEARRRSDATARRVLTTPRAHLTGANDTGTRVPMPSWWFAGIFLMGVGYLWVEGRGRR